MSHPMPGKCPVCRDALEVKRLECGRCGTAVEGDFELGKFARLSAEQLCFVEVFLASRGNIKEVERALQMSYPTVRNRLDALLTDLGLQPRAGRTHRVDRTAILNALDAEEITPEEAIRQLRGEELEEGRSE